MKNLKSIVFGVLVLLGIGCSPVYYPTSPVAPLLKEKGEKIVNGNLSFSALNINGAMALTEETAIMGGLQLFGVGEVIISSPNSSTATGG